MTNYEQKNFSVAQSRFDNLLTRDIVAIPFNATTTSHSRDHYISNSGIVGISIGVVVFIILLSISLLILIRKCMWMRQKRPQPNTSRLPSFSTQELANGSLWNVHRELSDNGKIELQNECVSELPLSTTPAPSGPFVSTIPPSNLEAEHLHTRKLYTVSSAQSKSVASSINCYRTKSSRRSTRSARPSEDSILCINLNKALPPLPTTTEKAANVQSPFSSPMSRSRSVVESIAATQSSTSLGEKDSQRGRETGNSSASTPISESFQVSTMAIRHHMNRPRLLRGPLSKFYLPVQLELPYAAKFDDDIYAGREQLATAARRSVVKSEDGN